MDLDDTPIKVNGPPVHFTLIGISPRNDHDRDPNLVRHPSRCVLTTNTFFFQKMNYCQASCGLGYCKSEYICFGKAGHGYIQLDV